MLKPGLTVQEALDIAFGEEDQSSDPVDTIFIAPPDPAILTDEDSGDEDGVGDYDNLSKRQLLADAEIRTLSGNVIGERMEEITSLGTHSNTGETAAEESTFFKKYELPKLSDPKEWVSGDFATNKRSFPEGDYSQFENKTVIDLFEMFIDTEIIEFLVQEASKYALFKNYLDPKVSQEEMKCFIAILILSGYNDLPSKRMYWEQRLDTRNELVYNAMRRNRFEQILRCVHLASNDNFTQNDKLWKIRPFVNLIKDRCRKFFVPEKDLAFDESMVKYYGKHSCKQFIRGKPIRFGYKVWSLNTSMGYLIDFEIYQGKSITPDADIEKSFGKAAAPLIKIIQEFPENLKLLPFSFYFDNLFTTFHLLYYLRLNGYGGTGTIRENRLPKNCPLADKKDLLKKERGYYENSISKTDGILVTKWVDNSVVCTATNEHGVNPVTSVRRYSQKEKKHIMVNRPALLAEYNKYMGGTDRMDQNVGQYRIQIRNRKWYWSLFTWLIDISIHNSWCLYRKSNNTYISQIEFRRTIAEVYLKKYSTAPKGIGRTPSLASNAERVASEIRFDHMDHLVEKIANNKRRRCSGRICKTSTRTRCRKCDVGLCIDCFVSYHTKPN